MLGDDQQIRIVQSGSELFAFDTITWPDGIFAYPIVYTACAMNSGSYDSGRIGWKWIERPQFEWLVRHYGCMVSYVGTDQPYTFYCNNHKCWERLGVDYPLSERVNWAGASDFDLEERDV